MRPEAPQAPPTLASLAARQWEWAALTAILLLALGLRVWNLEASGWGAEYYSAAVRSMGQSLSNFFFCAFDPAGFISVDKPPLALWLQVAGVKLLGFHPLSILLPQALLGSAAVGVLFIMLRPRLGAMASLLAALFLALSPVWVAVNRTNNTDSLLVFMLLLAAWALLKAAQEGSRGRLLLATALVGLAFNMKMLAAFIVLPAFFLVYALAAPLTWTRRIKDLTLAGLMALAVALPWVLAVELTPPESRPFVGSTQGNSMLQLVVGHNAWGRFFAKERTAATGPAQPAPTPTATGQPAPPAAPVAEARDRASRLLARMFVQEPIGHLRLARGKLAAQVMWLFPLACLALVLAGPPGGWRRPLSPGNLALFFWGAWTLTYSGVYSYLGGIFHYYYLSTLAPALAALAGAGLEALWDRYRRGGRQAAWLPLALLLTAAWQLRLQTESLGWTWPQLLEPGAPWLGWLHLGLAGASLAAALGLGLALLWRAAPRASRRLAIGSLSLGLMALLALPTIWGLSSVLRPSLGMVPSADLHRLLTPPAHQAAAQRARQRQAEAVDKLADFLLAHQTGERYLLATTTTHLAAPLIIRTGQAVMARGGFHGLDPALDPAKLARLVDQKQVRYVMLGDEALVSRRMGAEAAVKPMADWVREHGKLVEPDLWRGGGAGGRMELYDMRPEGEQGKAVRHMLDKPMSRREHVKEQSKGDEA